MSSKNISAFPDPGRAQSVKQREQLPNVGMSLRDYFAAKAMQSLVARHGVDVLDGEWDTDAICDGAYLIADEMLKVREE